MKKILSILDNLWQHFSENLTKNVSSVPQNALKDKLRPRNGAELIKLAGIVKNAPVDASVNPAHRL